MPCLPCLLLLAPLRLPLSIAFLWITNTFLDWRIGPNIALAASFWGYHCLKTGNSLPCLPLRVLLRLTVVAILSLDDVARPVLALLAPCPALSAWLLMLTFQTRSSLLSRGREQFCNWPSLKSCRWSWIQLKTLLFCILWYIPIKK